MLAHDRCWDPVAAELELLRVFRQIDDVADRQAVVRLAKLVLARQSAAV